MGLVPSECGSPSVGRPVSLPPPRDAVGRRDSAASRHAPAPAGLGPPPESVARRDVGGGAAGKSAEDAALVTGPWSQESAANSAAPPTRSRPGSRLGVTAPVADEQ